MSEEIESDSQKTEDSLDNALSRVGYSKKSFKEDIRFLTIFLLVFASIRFFVYDYFIIPSSSMVPSLLIGDMPLVEKWAYGYSKHSIWFSPNFFSGRIGSARPKRGEVIVFKAPEDNDTNVIKRVIAIPGDRVSVKDGIICVNGIEARITFQKRMIYHDIKQKTHHELVVYEEKLPLSDAPVHTVAYFEPAGNSEVNHFAEQTVPEGYYFVMGDNRDFSKDSRCGLGMVPEENLMGKAVRTIYSIDNGVKLWEPWLWFQNIRYSRILKKII
ncbi:MAG: signal peptidase I [Holosporaceae bacterium]|jgi:signal peptidase I|nr:signal peptidase I [Holosporaceae bacterium]